MYDDFHLHIKSYRITQQDTDAINMKPIENDKIP